VNISASNFETNNKLMSAAIFSRFTNCSSIPSTRRGLPRAGSGWDYWFLINLVISSCSWRV